MLEICPQLGPLPEGMTRVRLKVLSGREAIAQDARLSSVQFEEEFLTERQAVAEDLMLGARLARGLDEGLVSYAQDLLGDASEVTLDRLMEEGYLSDSLRPRRRGGSWATSSMESCGTLRETPRRLRGGARSGSEGLVPG